MSSKLSGFLQQKKKQANVGDVWTAEEKRLEHLYDDGASAFGSVANVERAAKISGKTVEAFLKLKDAHTKYEQTKGKLARLDVIAYDIIEKSSVDWAFVYNVADFNTGIRDGCGTCSFALPEF